MARTPETTPLTPAGKAALEAELEGLISRRTEVVARIAETRAEGDLSENAGYHQAREDQSLLEGRIAEIENALRTATIIEAVAGDGTVRLGTRVTVRDDDGDSTYTIVGPLEADPLAGRISLESPVGKAVLGHRAGDAVEVETPAGMQKLRILSVG